MTWKIQIAIYLNYIFCKIRPGGKGGGGVDWGDFVILIYPCKCIKENWDLGSW